MKRAVFLCGAVLAFSGETICEEKKTDVRETKKKEVLLRFVRVLQEDLEGLGIFLYSKTQEA